MTKKNNYRLYYEITWDGFVKAMLLEQFFVKDIKSKIIYYKEQRICDYFIDEKCLTVDFQKKFKSFIINSVIDLKKLNKTLKLKLKNVGTSIIVPVEIVSNYSFKSKIKNNYIKPKELEKIIRAKNKIDETNTPIIYERKEIIQRNTTFKVENMPRKLHKATLYVLYSSINSTIFDFLSKTISKNRYVGDIYFYSEQKGIRKSFSFFRIPLIDYKTGKVINKIKPNGELLIDWRDDYSVVEYTTENTYFKHKVKVGYNTIINYLKNRIKPKLLKEFDDKIVNHKFKVNDGFNETMTAVLGEKFSLDYETIKTKTGELKLSSNTIQQYWLEAIETALNEMGRKLNFKDFKEIEKIHFGRINSIDSFDKYLAFLNKEKGFNDYELNFNFNREFYLMEVQQKNIIQQKPDNISKNMLMFALNEKQEFIQENEDIELSKKELDEIQRQKAMTNFKGKIFN